MKLNDYFGKLLVSALILSTASTVKSLEITIVETRAGGQNLAWYAEGSGWNDSTAKSTAAGVTPNIGSRYSTALGSFFSVSPVLRDGATYTIDITHGESASISNNTEVAVSAVGGTIDVTNTFVFSRMPQFVWERVGILTLDPGVTTPTVTFTKLGPINGRFYADAVRFVLVDNPCLLIPELTTVNGPLAAGQTFVDVPMTNTAQAVTVYADGVQIGQKTGAVVGLNRVTTTPLVKGQVIAATQTSSTGTESCVPTSGQSVGSGPNPPIGIALSIRQTNLMESAIGINGGAPGSILKFIGATTNTGPSGAPLGNRIFYPSNEWQTVQFQRGDDPNNPIDPTYNWNAADATFGNALGYNFGVFDSICFTSDEDTGPFAIYIDDFRNGDTLITGWEGAALGQNAVTINLPNGGGTTIGNLLARSPGTVNPNVSMVTNNTVANGAHSLYVSWQFNTTNRSAWLRLPGNAGGTGSTPNAIVDLRLPISFRMLILPVGQEPPPLAAEAFSGPANQRVIRGGSVTMRFTYRGTPPLSFQWRHNGTAIPNATNATLALNNVQLSDAGSYTAVVSNSLGSDESPAGTLTVDDVPNTDIMTPAWTLRTGDRTYLANDNGTRSIAYSPATDHLLIASRSSGANIHVLDAQNGNFLFTLHPPVTDSGTVTGYVGGTLVLNQIGVAEDNGAVYAGNLTDDGATTEFKLYKWFGPDFPGEPGQLLWHGNPANDANIHLRWGDAMVVRVVNGGHQIILSSRTGTLLAMIQSDFPESPAIVCDISAAAGNSFRLGLAAGGSEGSQGSDYIWGKMTGLPLLQVRPDFSFGTGTILNSFSGLNNMGPIGINAAGTLLAGVFIDNPDHLRLFDISTPGTITAVDTELFPTDNANGNATGSVAFGIDKVYALDSNNGLIAMNIDTSCLPDKATIVRSGSDVIISWSRPTYSLQGTDALGGMWNPIPGASPVTVDMGTGMQFFRLICGN
jgi:immunoglobulin I-set domain protein